MADLETAGEARLKGATSPETETLLTPMESNRASSRMLLVRKLSDIVALPSGQLSANERSLAADILLQLLSRIEEPLRIEVAQRVARVIECPQFLLRALMLDERAVAEIIIEQSDTLPEALLIEAARTGTLAHRTMIAGRKGLTTPVVDALLQFEEIDVAKRILKREDSTLSPSAVNQLVAQSAVNEQLQMLLLRRPELEPAHGFMMFWWVGKEHRKRILARFCLERGVIQDALKDLYPRAFRATERDDLVKEILALCERRHRARGEDGEPISLDVATRTLASARKYPSQEIIDAVGRIANIKRSIAGRIVRDTGGEALVVLAKALGLPRDQFYGLFRITGDGAAAATEESTADAVAFADYLLSIFDSITRDCARAILRYWDWDGNPRIAQITRLMGASESEQFKEESSPLSAF